MLRVRYRIDGLLQTQVLPPEIAQFQAAIISRIKIMSRLNIAEKRLPQDGRIKIRFGDAEGGTKEIDFPGGIQGRFIQGACRYHWVGADPQTNANIYQNLGCRTNSNFRPVPGAQADLTGSTR